MKLTFVWFFQLGFVQTKVDYSLFTSTVGDHFTIALVYADAIHLTGNDLNTINHVKLCLRLLIT